MSEPATPLPAAGPPAPPTGATPLAATAAQTGAMPGIPLPAGGGAPDTAALAATPTSRSGGAHSGPGTKTNGAKGKKATAGQGKKATAGKGKKATAAQGKKGTKRRKTKAKRSWLDRVLLAAVIVVALALVAVGSGYAYLQYRFGQVAKVTVPHLKVAPVGEPFNVLLIGSDTRVGESSSDASHFGNTAQTAGQRSDVVKIVHIVPATGQASVLSIPRDTMVTVAGDTSQTGHYDRINSTYGTGPDQLVQTIQANFGIPIEHVVQIDFEGFRARSTRSEGSTSTSRTRPGTPTPG